MSNRKQPTPPPARALKPTPPPAPPAKRFAHVAYGNCFIYSNAGPMVCPLCRVTVPTSTEHRCERNG